MHSIDIQLRKKVESIIRRGEGVKDPDAPDDPESVGFWVTRKAKFNDRVKVKQSQHLHLHGRATDGFISDVSGGLSLGDGSCGANPTDALLALSKTLGQGTPELGTGP